MQNKNLTVNARIQRDYKCRLNKIQDKQLKYLRNRLKHLNQPAVMLIKEGIITMYSEITEVKDK